MDDLLLLCCTEVTTREQIDRLVEGVRAAVGARVGAAT
jgi:hypothetical protein